VRTPQDGSAGDVFERILAQLEGLRTVEDNRKSVVRLPFHNASTITGTAVLTVWTPTPGFKFSLKGFDITVVVDDDISSSEPVILGFWDGSVANGPIAPIAAFQDNDVEGTFFSVSRSYEEGIVSGAADRALVIAPNATIGSGVVHVMGVIWGDHVEG